MRRSWTEADLKDAVRKSQSIRQVLIKLGLKEAGGNYTQIKKYIRVYEINSNHFRGQGWSKGKKIQNRPKMPIRNILTKNSSYQSHKLKKRLLEEKIKSERCEICGWNEESEDGRIPLELDHINGDSRDNRLSNLRILCPNCHSLQPTHRGKNIKV